MSHAATNWAIQQRGLKPAAKIVLWHLADCHNGHTGQCNPRQAVLAERCEMSRSTVNVHLAELERRGLIRRVNEMDPKTKRQRPTHYVLAFDEAGKAMSGNRTRPQDVGDEPQDVAEPCPETGHGAVSENGPEPCPDSGQSRVRNPDSIMNPGIEPGIEPDARMGAREVFEFSDFVDRFLAAYPRNRDRAKVEHALSVALAGGADPAQIIAAAEAYAAAMHDAEPRYVQLPENWLMDRRWEEWGVRPPVTQADRDRATASLIKSGKDFLCRGISVARANALYRAGLVTIDECRAVGLGP